MAVNNQKNKIKVYIYNVENKVFDLKQTIDMSSTILGIVCNDFNEDGNVDLLVSTGTDSNVAVSLIFKDGNNGLFNVASRKLLAGSFLSQPVVFQQFNEQTNNLRTYFILQQTADVRTYYFYNPSTSSYSSELFSTMVVDRTFNTGCNSFDQIKGKLLSTSRASSFVDLNNDCRPDLVLESDENGKQYLEFYLSTDSGFCLVAIQPLNGNFHMASVFDVDGDGTNDLVLLKTNLELHVFYNQYPISIKSLCAKSDTYKPPFIGFSDATSSSVGLGLTVRNTTSTLWPDFLKVTTRSS